MVKFVDEIEDDVVISHNFKLWTRKLTIDQNHLKQTKIYQSRVFFKKGQSIKQKMDLRMSISRNCCFVYSFVPVEGHQEER